MSETKPARATEAEIEQWHQRIPEWKIENSTLVRTFQFKDFYQTMSFVNAVAWIANQQNHHPDLAVSYNRCTITYSTHSADGLTQLDFTIAMKIDGLKERG